MTASLFVCADPIEKLTGCVKCGCYDFIQLGIPADPLWHTDILIKWRFCHLILHCPAGLFSITPLARVRVANFMRVTEVGRAAESAAGINFKWEKISEKKWRKRGILEKEMRSKLEWYTKCKQLFGHCLLVFSMASFQWQRKLKQISLSVAS